MAGIQITERERRTKSPRLIDVLFNDIGRVNRRGRAENRPEQGPVRSERTRRIRTVTNQPAYIIRNERQLPI